MAIRSLGTKKLILLSFTCINLILVAVSFVSSYSNITVLPQSYCHEQWREQKLTKGAIAVLTILSVFGAIVMCATCFEICITEEFQKFIVCRMPNRSFDSQILVSSEELEPSSPVVEYQPIVSPRISSDQRLTTRNFGEKLLLSFSLISNVSKLFNTKESSLTLSCVHGIRFISMSWVILGHVFVFSMYFSNNVQSFFLYSLSQWTFNGIASATVSVDTFFVMSGVLTAYMFYREYQIPGGAFSKFSGWIIFYVHRYWRLTPVYMILLGLDMELLRLFWDGPLWPQTTGFDVYCNKSWWTNVLYINNFVHTNETCFGWAWYLANEMQFYIVSPIFMIPIFHYKWLGALLLLAGIVTNMITVGVISSINNAGAGFFGIYNIFEKVYIKPWCRIGTYLIGIAVGYVLHRTQCKLKLHWVVVLGGWILATVLALVAIYSLYNVNNGVTQLNRHIAALYNSTHRIAWGLAIGWVIFACCSGYGGWVNRFLSWKVMVPLSRLTYCAYLVHPLVIFFFFGSNSKAFYMNNASMVCYYFAVMMASYAVAFIVSMVFEAPMMNVERVLRTR